MAFVDLCPNDTPPTFLRLVFYCCIVSIFGFYINNFLISAKSKKKKKKNEKLKSMFETFYRFQALLHMVRARPMTRVGKFPQINHKLKSDSRVKRRARGNKTLSKMATEKRSNIIGISYTFMTILLRSVL